MNGVVSWKSVGGSVRLDVYFFPNLSHGTCDLWEDIYLYLPLLTHVFLVQIFSLKYAMRDNTHKVLWKHMHRNVGTWILTAKCVVTRNGYLISFHLYW